MKAHGPARRLAMLKMLAWAAVTLLGAKVVVSIVLQYGDYFPPNFDSAFLIGREQSFRGIYPPAFYAHIIAGPFTLLLAAYLMFSGKRKTYHKLHRRLGKLQVLLVLVVIVPSGLIMAAWAFSGPIAGSGFALQSIATGITAALAARYAMIKKIAIHQIWATRCFVLLISPLIFRLISGTLIVTESESVEAYQVNAWLSWLVPLLVYEVWRYRQQRTRKSALVERNLMEATS
ncbi:DUF2306 domain-containing protein [Bremerella cremea]|uniref:DUF2306 domain-containing protein n=1 Tax=Bremerella cremea TaxID=1031537 RepID=A0A368KLE4_9BACT|nr:DUF2306 domain-containing protein [Bremerella cremea]RCS40588.1 DUF2306 domain-containing protein [Bremerella cremea]